MSSSSGALMPSTPNCQRTPSAGTQARSTSGRATTAATASTAVRPAEAAVTTRARAASRRRRPAGDQPEADDRGGTSSEQAHDHSATPARPTHDDGREDPHRRPEAGALGRGGARCPPHPAARVATAVPRT